MGRVIEIVKLNAVPVLLICSVCAAGKACPRGDVFEIERGRRDGKIGSGGMDDARARKGHQGRK